MAVAAYGLAQQRGDVLQQLDIGGMIAVLRRVHQIRKAPVLLRPTIHSQVAARASLGNGRDEIAHGLSPRRSNERQSPGSHSACCRGRIPRAAWAKRNGPGTKRHRRPRPRPHTPFTTRALSIPTDAAPPPNGSPFIGKMMNHEVSVGGKAPNSAATTQ